VHERISRILLGNTKAAAAVIKIYRYTPMTICQLNAIHSLMSMDWKMGSFIRNICKHTQIMILDWSSCHHMTTLCCLSKSGKGSLLLFPRIPSGKSPSQINLWQEPWSDRSSPHILTLISGHFHFDSLVQCPDEIRHNSAGIPAVPFKEPLPAYAFV
jgi:hypothetical protein